MAHGRRMSESFTAFERPTVITAPAVDSQEWINYWQGIFARDVIDSRIVKISGQTSVEDACDVGAVIIDYCAALSPSSQLRLGLFDFSDVNAFLTLAATRHTLTPEDLRENRRVDEIVTAARAGRVPVHLVSNLSQKNPLVTLPYDSTIISLLEQFSRGTHRVLIQGPSPSSDFLGMVSDHRLLTWFSLYASRSPSLQMYLSNPLHSLALPSLHLDASVIAATSHATVLDAMKLMSEEGVSSIAVVDEGTETLLSAVSVTDIGKIVVPSESNHILSAPLQQFIAQIKAPHGCTDGADRYPVYSVLPSSPLSYTVQKLLATNAHRLFVTKEEAGCASPIVSHMSPGNLTGIVSIVDILSLFARIANIEDVDPTRMQRHRRASSASSQSSMSASDGSSRPSSRTSVRRSLSHKAQNARRSMNRTSRTSLSSMESTDINTGKV
ncbi:hypothetical protein BDZ89DRAFT_1237035 [Hymenopellis radicata]|nr:hypothetical protein BDZ89DRAFT_1237035 [Hymenopellis radicata]